jgi:hypothetical protein
MRNEGRAPGHRRGVRTIGWILALATAGGSGALAPRSALADEPASFEWNAPLSCPTREAVLDRLGQGSAPGATRRIDTRVTVEQDGEDHYQARVDLVAGHQWSNRSLEASTREAIADAVVVIVRVAAAAIPPDPLPAVEPPAAPPPTPAGSSRAPSPRLRVDSPRRADTTSSSSRFGSRHLHMVRAAIIAVRNDPDSLACRSPFAAASRRTRERSS